MPAEAPTPEAARREPGRPGPCRRLFFALWPDEAMREAMAHATLEAARASGGRPVPASNLHITLVFLGSVPEGWLPELAEAARAAAPWPAVANAGAPGSPGGSVWERGSATRHRLELAFDHMAHWRSAQLLCALPAAAPALLAALAGRLQGQLATCGFPPDLESSRSPRQFRPHVTLARRAHRPPRKMEMQPVTWSFADFVLMDSKTLPAGPVYTALERFPFGH